MDLDKIKTSWQQIDPKPSINNDKILQMLRNTRNGAFNKLLSYEKIGLYISPTLIFLSFLLKDQIISIIFLCSICIGMCWQVYKYIYLKRINIADMSIVEVSKRISKYKVYLYRELIITFVWALFFTILFIILVIYNDQSYQLDVNKTSDNRTNIIWGFCIWSIIIVPLGTYILYRKLFIKNITKIEESLIEAKNFEIDDED